ncbi:MAG TPA: GNAT family N-acetyltransferase [Candidatus Kapabacteria bacterium]|nr:GNAT family N-acetyltransferase [Candidatus Kapabacteria bacterium]
MTIQKQVEQKTYAIKITSEEDGTVLGRVYVYVIYNGLHDEPYGLLEDLYVEEAHRSKGIGKALVLSAIEEAKARGCRKIICTSRHARTEVHAWYKKLGFQEYGLEFRMDLIS